MLRKRGRLETQWGSERLVLTFLTINESGKWSHLKMSLLSNEILQQELTLVQNPVLIHHDPKKRR